MTLTPASWASLVTARPVVGSVWVSSRTCTCSVLIIWSAIDFSCWSLPCAFWMSQSRFFFAHSALRAGRSAPSQRAEVAVSGRMMPIFGLAPPLLELPEEEELGEEELEHAATPSARAAAPTVAVRTALRIIASWSFLSAGPVATSARRLGVHGML